MVNRGRAGNDGFLGWDARSYLRNIVRPPAITSNTIVIILYCSRYHFFYRRFSLFPDAAGILFDFKSAAHNNTPCVSHLFLIDRTNQSDSARVWRMSGLTRNGTADPVPRNQILRRERGQGKKQFSLSSADHEQN